jgi:hypothetical protein
MRAFLLSCLASLVAGDGFYAGEPGQSCEGVCTANGHLCDEQLYMQKMGTINPTGDELAGIVDGLRGLPNSAPFSNLPTGVWQPYFRISDGRFIGSCGANCQPGYHNTAFYGSNHYIDSYSCSYQFGDTDKGICYCKSGPATWSAGEVVSKTPSLIDTIPVKRVPTSLTKILDGEGIPFGSAAPGSVNRLVERKNKGRTLTISWTCDSVAATAAILPVFTYDMKKSFINSGEEVPSFCVPLPKSPGVSTALDDGKAIVLGHFMGMIEVLMLDMYYGVTAPMNLLQYILMDSFYMWT